MADLQKKESNDNLIIGHYSEEYAEFVWIDFRILLKDLSKDQITDSFIIYFNDAIERYPSKEKIIINIQKIIEKYNIEIDFEQWFTEINKKWNKQQKTNKEEYVKDQLSFGLSKSEDKIFNLENLWKLCPFFYSQGKMFWLWNNQDKKWQQTDETDIMRIIRKSFKMSGVEIVNKNTKSEYMEAFRHVGRDHIPKEQPKNTIQFKDKLYNYETKEIKDVTPEYFVCNPIPWELGETEETPIMDRIITEWLGEEYLYTFYEIISYCCIIDYPIHTLFCFAGGGSNGKSKALTLINNFIGAENTTTADFERICTQRFETANLYKKLVCMMGETNFGSIEKTDMLKRLTGQDLITYEFKGKDGFSGHNYAKILISSNSLPSSEDTSEGFYRRWFILNFNNQFSEGKDILAEIPQVEYNNLAKKVCKIIPELLKNCHFSNQGSIQDRKKKYIEVSNPFKLFIQQCCVIDDSKYVKYGELYGAYVYYLTANKRRVISHKEFGKTLDVEGFVKDFTSKKVNDVWVKDRFINGILMKEDWKVSFGTLGLFGTHSLLNPSICKSVENQVPKSPKESQTIQNSILITEEYINTDLESIKTIIFAFAKDGLSLQQLCLISKIKGITEQSVGKIIDKMKEKGEILEFRPGFIKMIE